MTPVQPKPVMIERRWLPLLVGALLVAAGCSGDDDASTDGTSPVTGTAPVTAVASGPTQPSSSTSSSTTTTPDDVPATDEPQEPATTAPTTLPPATTTAPGSTVAPGTPQITLDSVPIDESVAVDETATIAIVSVAAGEATARLPGEVAGPAAIVTVEISNDSAAPIDVGAVTVNLLDGDGAVASPLTTDPAAPMEGTLEPGGSATGVYVFSFPEGSPEPVRVEVSRAVAAPVAVFVGRLG